MLVTAQGSKLPGLPAEPRETTQYEHDKKQEKQSRIKVHHLSVRSVLVLLQRELSAGRHNAILRWLPP